MGQLVIWLWFVTALVWLDLKITKQAASVARRRGSESRDEWENIK